MQHKQVCKFGFTLAELMAVVVIISLMVVLSVGYYRRSIEQARFAEGLMAASTISEGINRYWMDNASLPASFSVLDIQLSKRSSCTGVTRCLETEHFRVATDTNGVTTAQRKDGKYKELYYIQIQPHFASSHRDQIACVGADDNGDGKAFCESMGYTTCSDANVCTKPL